MTARTPAPGDDENVVRVCPCPSVSVRGYFIFIPGQIFPIDALSMECLNHRCADAADGADSTD